MVVSGLRTGVVLLAVLAATAARAEDRVPANLALQLLLKVVTYDQSFGGRGDGDFVVLVPSSSAETAALSEAMSAAKAMPPKIQNRTLKFVPVGWDTLAAAISEQNASAVLLISGASDTQITSAVKAATGKKLYSLSLDPSYVEQGALVGVAVKDGKPQLVIHLTAAKDAGITFPSSVLKIAKTVR